MRIFEFLFNKHNLIKSKNLLHLLIGRRFYLWVHIKVYENTVYIRVSTIWEILDYQKAVHTT